LKWRQIIIQCHRDTHQCSPDYQHNELHLLPDLLSDTALAPGEEEEKQKQSKCAWVFAESEKMLNLICWNKFNWNC